jgi:asparagine synthase (glutamine-hydrolysing)
MCGIAGFVGPRNTELLHRMGERVRHRGPDQNGVFEDDGCSLNHKRLSIIDLSEAGRQPMATPDGRFTIAYNGEVYNYLELRKRYEREGWTFRTKTDTECFLASAALHGLHDLDQFHGMFAFALWDSKERVCFVARDRMGIKPLYVTRGLVDGRIAFASELPAVLEIQPSWALDETARSMYLTVGYVPGPRTMFADIRSLEPGHLFSISTGRFREIARFDAAARQNAAIDHADARERLISIVDTAVSDQLVSDRPVGVFLSGGMDSSVVVSSMRKARPNATIKTFTTKFKHHTADPKFNRDAELARSTAKRYGCEHHEIDVGAEDLMRNAETMALSLGQPHNNHSTVALDAAARLAAADVTVVLSGDGGDESFGGYDRYKLVAGVSPFLASGIGRAALRLYPRTRKWQDALSATDEAGRLLSFHATSLADRRALYGSSTNDDAALDAWRTKLHEIHDRDGVSRFMALDRATWLRDDAFVRSDRLTMRHGLELRVPLTDDAVVEYAASLPRGGHVNAFQTKRLWRDAFADRCLPEVMSEQKRGWFPPTAKWLREGLTDWTRTILDEAISTHAWMNGEAIRGAFNDHLAGAYRLQDVWTVVAYQLWWRAYGMKIKTS